MKDFSTLTGMRRGSGRYAPPSGPRPFRIRVAGKRLSLSGFTLVELLVVVAIISFLAVVSLPNMVATLRGMQITQGGQLIETQLQLARQRALADNRTVEVRFYSYATSTGTAAFQGIQQFVISTSGTSATPADKYYPLPGNMIMDSGNGQTSGSQTLSTLLNQPTTTPLSPSQLLNAQAIGLTGTNYTCVTFRFNPNGSTNLTPVSNSWFVTVHALTDGNNLTKAPNNYYTVQVDAYNGHIYDFHP
jgi:uncharacterized protein (TIGR02596 family)